MTEKEYIKAYARWLEEQLEKHDLDIDSARLHFDGCYTEPFEIESLLDE